MTNIDNLDTPALLLDRGRFERNCAGMIAHLHARGTRLRPHMKTLKSADAARVAVDPDHGGIAVSTLNEAEYFAANGFRDIQLAVCLPPNKLDRAAAMLAQDADFSFFVDSVDAARAAAAHGARFNIWIEVDSGEHRTGVRDHETLGAVAEALRAGGSVRFAGLATHGGHSYDARAPAGIADVAEQERRTLTEAAAFLAAKGVAAPALSAGSTPTALHGGSAEGLTEIRAGVYMAGDLFQEVIGSLAAGGIAASVLATVISSDPATGRVVVDAGGLALSKDRSTAGTPQDAGYGRVCDRLGEAMPDRRIDNTFQEHGEMHGVDAATAAALKVGTRVRIQPNHVCMTAAMYDRLHVVDGEAVVAIWPRTNGWGPGG